MTPNSDDESESSLPTKTVPTLPSSPPIFNHGASSPKMEIESTFKSELPIPQGPEVSQIPSRRRSSDETERPPSAQQPQGDADESGESSSEESEEEEENSDPAERIANFDWNDLHERYHEAVNKCQGREAELVQEWQNLMNYFQIWAESGHGHETGRTYSRLRTRMTYVQHSEEKLEKTRNHYTNVVRAFESALNLLKAQGFGA